MGRKSKNKGVPYTRAKQVSPMNAITFSSSHRDSSSEGSRSGDTEQGGESGHSILTPEQLKDLSAVILTPDQLENWNTSIQLFAALEETLKSLHLPSHQKNTLRHALNKISESGSQTLSTAQISKLNSDLIELQATLLQTEQDLQHESTIRITLAGLFFSLAGTVTSGAAAVLLGTQNTQSPSLQNISHTQNTSLDVQTSKDSQDQNQWQRSILLTVTAAMGFLSLILSMVKISLDSKQETQHLATNRTSEIRKFTETHTSALLITSDTNNTLSKTTEIPEPTYEELYHNLAAVQGMLSLCDTSEANTLVGKIKLHLPTFYEQNHLAREKLEDIVEVMEEVEELANNALKASSSNPTTQSWVEYQYKELLKAARKAHECTYILSEVTKLNLVQK